MQTLAATRARPSVETHRFGDLEDVLLPCRDLALGAHALVVESVTQTFPAEVMAASEIVCIPQEAVAADRERERGHHGLLH